MSLTFSNKLNSAVSENDLERLDRPSRLYLLDNIRGIASLSVVLWHYQAFYMSSAGVLPSDFRRSAQPLYSILWPLYEYGFHAVQLFFVISGFVFFCVYFDSVRYKRTTWKEFFIARFSRLYPLHAATLLFVACGQQVFIYTKGEFVVYPYNDAYHFLLNGLLACRWGLEQGWSFNAPVWSVSIEVILYIAFFLYAKYVAGRSFVPLTSIAFFILLFFIASESTSIRTAQILAHSALCFFVGGAVFCVLRLAISINIRVVVSLLIVSVVIAVSGSLIFMRYMNQNTLHIFVFPAAIMVAAIIQNFFPEAGRSSRSLGDLSYSTYLLHFPLQLSLIFFVQAMGIEVNLGRPENIAIFMILLLFISAISFYRFERPAQVYLRAKMGARRRGFS